MSSWKFGVWSRPDVKTVAPGKEASRATTNLMKDSNYKQRALCV